MREKKSIREGRRTGLKIHNVKRNPDGIENFKDYFANSDDEEDSTNLETEESEMQDTLPGINFTRVSLESDTTNTSEYPYIHHKSQGNSSNDEDENEISPRRRQIETSGVHHYTHSGSSVHRSSSRTKESKHLPKPKTKERIERKNKLKSMRKAPSPTSYVLGRPQRTRIRPLAYWKGEYRTFRHTKDGDIVLAEMHLVDSPSIRIPRKVDKPVVKKRRIDDDIISKQEQLYFYDEKAEKKKKLVGVHQERNWIGGALGPDPAYRVAHKNLTKNFTSGYLELDINGTKEEQYSPELNLNFIVIQGIVRFTLRDRDVGEMAVDVGRTNDITIPRKIPYSLRNCYAGKSLLFFYCIEDF